MILSDSKKFAFIHVPKTGGSTISFVLNQYSKRIEIDESKHGWQIPLHTGPMHDKFVNARKHIPEDYYTFAFVRNPFEVLVSGFKRKKYPDFNNFIEMSLGENSNYIFNRHTQYEYLSHDGTSNGKILLSHIGKYETFAEDFDIIAQDIRIPERYKDLPRKNASYKDEKSYREYYNEKTRNAVEKRYKKDLEYFGYEF